MPTHLPPSDSESNKRQRTDSSVAGASDAIPASVAVASVATPVANHGHYLKANIVGVLCTKCGCPVQIRGSKLWIPNRKVIKRHWKNNPQCYVGNQFPNASNTESQLKADQIAMHERISRQPSAAQSLLSDAFPTDTVIKRRRSVVPSVDSPAVKHATSKLITAGRTNMDASGSCTLLKAKRLL